MRRVLVVSCVYRPTVFSQIHIFSASIDHRLNTYCHSVGKSCAVSASSIVRNTWSLVHFFSDSVTFQFPYYREAERFSIRLYRVSDIACTVSFNSLLNALEQRSPRHVKELAGFRINFSDWKSIAGITVVSLVQSSDVT